jgi:hypothetical protein
MASSQIPYATEQGIFLGITGKNFAITGNLARAEAQSPERCTKIRYDYRRGCPSASWRLAMQHNMRNVEESGFLVKWSFVSNTTPPRDPNDDDDDEEDEENEDRQEEPAVVREPDE